VLAMHNIRPDLPAPPWPGLQIWQVLAIGIMMLVSAICI
jgi:hypothetical protein